MRELPELAEVRAAWLDQPEEDIPVNIERIRSRRTWELFSITRSEIAGSVGAALFFAGFMAWRFAPERGRLLKLGCVGVIVWVAVTLFRFRRSIRPRASQPDALARTGLEHYREQLLLRQHHLRSAWIWHGPLLLAGILSAAIFAGGTPPGRFWDVLPLVVVLAGWVAIGIKRRRRQVADLEREIDEISELSPQ
jgi:hypothetical protein